MDRVARNHGVAVVIGVVLVVIGAGLLLDRVVGPLLRPLFGALQVVGYILWPLILVVAGVALLAGGLGSGAERRAVGGLYRSRTDRVIGGVLGGVADRFGLEASLVRIVYVVFSLITGLWAGLLLYVIALALLPEGESSAVVSAPARPVSASSAPMPPVHPSAPVTTTPPDVPV